MALTDQEKKELIEYTNTVTVQQSIMTMAKADLQSELRTNADALSDASVDNKLAKAKLRIKNAAQAIVDLT